MRKKKVLGALLVLCAVGGAAYWFFHKKAAKSDKGAVTRVITAVEGPMEETVDSTGEVAALNRVEIKPPIQGRIEKILADEGSRVKAGDILAWMSSSDRAAILDAARAQGPEEVKKWEDTYKPTPIVAPLAGVIILKNVVVGQTVDVGTVLFALADRLIVMGHVDEVDVGRIKIGMPARITLDSYPDHPIGGKIFNILHEGTNVSNVITYGVKVEPREIPPFFRSQMTANISFIASRKENAVLVPASAVTDNRVGEKQVLIPGPDGKPVPQIVKTGLENGENVEILSGLKAGDRVIVTRKRYTPQQAASSSPLVFGGNQQRGGTGGGGGGNRSGGGR